MDFKSTIGFDDRVASITEAWCNLRNLSTGTPAIFVNVLLDSKYNKEWGNSERLNK